MAVAHSVIHALVLAGGHAPWRNTPKALLPINDRPLLTRTVEALTQVPQVATVTVVAPAECAPLLPPSLRVVQAHGDLWTNVLAGLTAIHPSPEDFVFLCAADIPFVTATALQQLLEMAEESGADLVSLAVHADAVRQFCGNRDMHRTTVRLKDGEFTGGNVLLVRAQIVPQIDGLARRAVQLRKQPWRLGQLAGWRTIWRFLIGCLSVCDLERRAEELLGCRCKAIIAPLPELAFDVDKPADYDLALQLLPRSAND